MKTVEEETQRNKKGVRLEGGLIVALVLQGGRKGRTQRFCGATSEVFVYVAHGLYNSDGRDVWSGVLRLMVHEVEGDNMVNIKFY